MGTLRSVCGLLLVVLTMYVGSQIVPAYMANVRLAEAIDDAAHDLSRNLSPNEEETRDRIVLEARALDIKLKPEQVGVRRVQNEGVAWANYTVHLDFPVHPVDLHFQPASRNSKLAGGI
jgi:hypothetical protein